MHIAGDGSGGAIIAWQDLRDGFSTFNIYAAHVSSGGVLPVSLSGFTLE